MITTKQLEVGAGTGSHTDRFGHPVPADWLDHLGWFRFYFHGDRWTWSPQIEQMHGYAPDTTAPSTFLVLSHVHPGDYQRVAAILHDVRHTPEAFSSRHRIVDTSDRVHEVVMTGVPLHDMHGAPAGIQGLCVDLSQAAVPADQRRYEHTTNQLRIFNAGKDYPENRRRRIRAATRC